MKLSDEAIAAIMMALQKGLVEQVDVVNIIRQLDFVKHPDTKKWGSKNGKLTVKIPPKIEIENVKVED